MIVAGLVEPIFATATTPPSFTSSTAAYDIAINGVPFFLSLNKEQPLVRETAEYRKQQIDQSAEPGEQSLVYWWLRSQRSFHGGAGRLYADPDASDADVSAIQFHASRGLDVWTQGRVSVLPDTERLRTVAGESRMVPADGASLVSDGGLLYRVTTAGVSTAVTWGGGGTILSLVTDGENYYAADATGIYKGALAGGAGALIYNTGSANVALGWVKQRLMAGVGNAVYELSPSGTGGPALPTAKYTHPAAGWRTTAFAEAPGAILAAGYAGVESAVLSFTLDSSGAVPTLSAAVVAAQLPSGERVHALHSYLGYLGVGTDMGLRVGQVQGDQLAYGPLTITTDHPVRAVTGFDRFLYVGVQQGADGEACLFRVDLSQPTSSGRYAYASDLEATGTGPVRGVAVVAGRPTLTVDTDGLYAAHATRLAPAATLTTGRVRFNTIEAKLYKAIRVRLEPGPVGLLSVSVSDSTGKSAAVVTYGASSVADETQLQEPPTEWVQLTFTFTRDGGLTGAPVLAGYQLKALPAAKRQRMETLPVLLFDYEKDRNGVRVGSRGSAIKRLLALEKLEEAGAVVLLQHMTSDKGGRLDGLVQIDGIRFVQTDPPDKLNGWGGIAFVKVRTVT